jgi:hypothetical protein
MSRSVFARGAILAVLCTLAGAQATTAQNISGSLVGNVTDSSGAYSIPNIPTGIHVTNTPHFSYAAANISNNGVGTVTSTDRTGRQYDEREWRVGARFGF